MIIISSVSISVVFLMLRHRQQQQCRSPKVRHGEDGRGCEEVRLKNNGREKK